MGSEKTQFKAGSERASKMGRKGAQKLWENIREPKMDPKDLPDLATPDDCKTLLALVARAVLTGEADAKAADVSIRAVRAWLEAHASSLTTQGLDDLMRRLEELERAAKSGRPSLEVS